MSENTEAGRVSIPLQRELEPLLPCPFCGDVPELPDGIGTQYEIECDCGMARSGVQICDLMTVEERMTGWDTITFYYKPEYIERAKKKAIEQWNTRF